MVPPRSPVALAVAAAILAALVPALPGADAAVVSVTVSNFAFAPSTVTIAGGDSVKWTWSSGTHNVHEVGTGTQWCSTRTAPASDCTRTFPSDGTFQYECTIHTSMRGTVTVGTPPTVAITSPASGSTISGTVPVTGTVSHPTDAIGSVSIRVDGGPFSSASLSGGSWTFSLDTTTLADGARTLTARATTVTGKSADASIAVTVDNPDTRDLSVSGVTGSWSTNGVLVSSTIHNGGSVATGSFTALFEYRYDGVWRTIGTRLVFDLAGRSSAPATLLWQSPFLVGAFEVRVTADSGAVVAETDEGNNSATGSVAFVTPLVGGQDVRDPVVP